MKKSQAELKQEITEASKRVEVDGIYAHYKNPSHTYRVVDFAVNTEYDTVWVIYKSLYEEEVTFLRSVDEWCEDVEKDGQVMKRFSLIETQNA